MLDAIFYAHEEIKKIVRFINEIVEEVGKEKMAVELVKAPADLEVAVRAFATEKIDSAIRTAEKLERLDKIDAVENETKERFEEEFPESEKDISGLIFTITKECMRAMILDEGVRIDDRKLDEVRPIWCETGVLPRVHGTGQIGRAHV